VTAVGRADKEFLRSWLAIALGTLVVTTSFWSTVYAFTTSATGEQSPAWAFALAASLIPMAFVILAIVSAHLRPGGAVTIAMLLAAAFGFVLLPFDPATAVIAAYSAGGVAALRRPAHSTIRARAVAAFGAVLLAWALLWTVTIVGLALAPALPFTFIGLADLAMRGRRQ